MKYIFNPFTSNFDALSPTALSIPSNQIFADNNGRDTYFAAHKNELESGSTFIMVGNGFQLWSGATNPVGYSNTNWTDVSSVVKGVKGEKGDAGSVADLTALIKEYGSDGRIRFDAGSKHFYFEVKQPDGSWLTKLEVGGSIIVDVIRLIKGTKPISIKSNELAIYNREITLPDGSKTIRPTIVLPDNNEYGLVVDNQQTGEVQLRKNDGTLIDVPIVYEDANGNRFTDLSKIKITGATLTKDMSSKELSIKVIGGSDSPADIVTKLETLIGDDRLSAEAVKGLMQEYEVINIDSNLTIDKSNYLDYRYKTLSCTKDDDTVQNILLPEIKAAKGAADFTIVNSRTSGRLVWVRPFTGDTIKNRDIEVLDVFESITLERPIRGDKWIVKSRNTDKMDGGEI